MRIAITGASGLIGTGLTALLQQDGHQVVRLVRRPAGPDEISWNPAARELEASALEGVEAVVHLSGANIAAGRFTAARKREIRDSRVLSTQLLSERLATLAHKPALICASAIGFYGDRPGDPVDERSPKGQGFLAEVCAAWEAATEPARQAGLRVCQVRVGAVLSARGGALKELLLPFKLGVGGKLGAGTQGFSWIDYDDILGVFRHCLMRAEIAGPVNGTAPQPATNATFGKMLGKVLHRPSLLPLPGAVIRGLLGEMGQVLLLEGAKVEPRVLRETGFRFRYPTLEESLRHQLGR